MDGGVQGSGNICLVRWREGKERGRVWGILEFIVGVDVCQVSWVGEVAVKKSGEKQGLDLWRQEVGNDLET